MPDTVLETKDAVVNKTEKFQMSSCLHSSRKRLTVNVINQ